MSYGYVYKTTNLKTGKTYIGKKKGVFNPQYLGSGLLIKNAINAHGKKYFKSEVICYLPTPEQCNEFEKFIIEKYREIVGRDNVYNIADGGDGGNTFKNTPEDCKRMADISHKRIHVWNKGLTKKDHPSMEKIANSKIGKTTWNAGKKGVQESWNKGTKGIMKPNSGSFIKGQTSIRKGIPMSQASKDKLSASQKIRLSKLRNLTQQPA